MANTTPAPDKPSNDSSLAPENPSNETNMNPSPAHQRKLDKSAKEVRDIVTPKTIER